MLLTANASDADSTLNAMLTYSIDSGDGASQFTINSTTGEVGRGWWWHGGGSLVGVGRCGK